MSIAKPSVYNASVVFTGLADAMMVPTAGQLMPVMDTLLAPSTVPFYPTVNFTVTLS